MRGDMGVSRNGGTRLRKNGGLYIVKNPINMNDLGVPPFIVIYGKPICGKLILASRKHRQHWFYPNMEPWNNWRHGVAGYTRWTRPCSDSWRHTYTDTPSNWHRPGPMGFWRLISWNLQFLQSIRWGDFWEDCIYVPICKYIKQKKSQRIWPQSCHWLYPIVTHCIPWCPWNAWFYTPHLQFWSHYFSVLSLDDSPAKNGGF